MRPAVVEMHDSQSRQAKKERRMKRTAIAIAVGALSIGLAQGLLAQDEELDQEPQGQEEEVRDEDEPAGSSDEQAASDATVEESGDSDVEPAEEAEDGMSDPDEEPDEEDDSEQEISRQDPDQTPQDQAAEGNDLTNMEVSEILGFTVYSQEDDEEIGDVERVISDTQNDDIYVVIMQGGFLGFGKDEIGYKLDDLELRNDDELVVGSTDDGESGDYGSDRYEDLDGSQTLLEAMQGN
jgi:hypothetical protein